MSNIKTNGAPEFPLILPGPGRSSSKTETWHLIVLGVHLPITGRQCKSSFCVHNAPCNAGCLNLTCQELKYIINNPFCGLLINEQGPHKNTKTWIKFPPEKDNHKNKNYSCHGLMVHTLCCTLISTLQLSSMTLSTSDTKPRWLKNGHFGEFSSTNYSC